MSTKQLEIEMATKGEQHARAGGKLVPFELQHIDAEIFGFIKSAGLVGIETFRAYNRLRGAFNDGWTRVYLATIFA